MFDRMTGGRSFGRHMVLAGVTAGSTLIGVSAALAGSCPSDKMKADARQPVTHAGKGVTDTVLAAIDLEKEPANIKERQLRFRKLTIEPGGIVPWHSHGDRPAIIYIAEGEIVEYASNCAVPIVHKAGEIRPETSGTSHWWQNTGKQDRHPVCGRRAARQERPQHVMSHRSRLNRPVTPESLEARARRHIASPAELRITTWHTQYPWKRYRWRCRVTLPGCCCAPS